MPTIAERSRTNFCGFSVKPYWVKLRHDSASRASRAGMASPGSTRHRTTRRRDVFRAAIRAQSLNALGQAYLLIGKDNVVRIDAPETTDPIALDDYARAKEELPDLARSLVEAA